MNNPTFSTRWNADVIDEHYHAWKSDPGSVDSRWTAFFEGFELGLNGHAEEAVSTNGANLSNEGAIAYARMQARFTGAIYAYRSIGHTQATLNPLYREPPRNPRLSLKRLGFADKDLDTAYDTGNYLGGVRMNVRELLENLERTYCGNLAVEYLHIQETPRRRFLQAAMEPSCNHPDFSRQRKLRILEKILEAEIFEKFLHTRFVGQKRFGLEGGETLIAALDTVLELGPASGIEEIVMGMAHRGRLNVLANIMGKSFEYIFTEFDENYIPEGVHGDGDVKYHLGFDSVVRNSRGEAMIINLAANPSHLEAVNPVVQGRARARQRILGDMQRKMVLPILIHGDAAFAGQGIVAEVLNFSQLKGYTTGGTLHFIVNNQIGFTTDPSEARSSRYCTDVAKMIEAPIFHVNGDDPVAMAWATELALAYRQEFGADVVIDMVCYRRHGHNEADEPAFTQPLLYKQIKSHPLISETYAKALRKEGELDEEEEKKIKERFEQTLQESFDRVKDQNNGSKRNFAGSTAVFQPPYSFQPVRTHPPLKRLEAVAKHLSTVPPEIKVNPKIVRQLKAYGDAFTNDTGLNWAFAESLAWGTLMLEGTPVRLSGQDSARGTFSQRHAVLLDTETREPYKPLEHLPNSKALFCVHNSLLSEAAVLGFDYGYSLDYPQMLCMWEAQFGDFANGAQVIIDQFLSSSESKWQRISGLVLLLPHGYEGQGPEHSSARLERFLQACAEDNLQVCNLSTPAQYFHVLRRQMKRDFRKPLVIMSPKSLLRHKECVSYVKDFSEGQFHCVLDDPQKIESPQRLILCSGKVFYDLQAYRREQEITDTTIVRLEQLYPLDRESLTAALTRCAAEADLVWCQEESANMGAWSHLAPSLEELAGRKFRYAGRDASASPAVGSLARHKHEQQILVAEAFGR